MGVEAGAGAGAVLHAQNMYGGINRVCEVLWECAQCWGTCLGACGAVKRSCATCTTTFYVHYVLLSCCMMCMKLLAPHAPEASTVSMGGRNYVPKKVTRH